MTNAFASIAQGLNEAIRLGVSRELLIERWLTEKSSWAELATDQ